MKKLFSLLMLMLLGLPLATAADFVAGTTYYIDGSKSTLLNANAVIKVKTGSTEVNTTNIGNSILTFIPSQNCSTVEIKRYNPNNLSECWNTASNISAPSDASKFAYQVNSSLNGGSWVAYNPSGSGSSSTPDAWIVSQKATGWDKSKKDYTFDYNSTTKLYSITIDASKLQDSGDSDGFKIGYNTANTDNADNWSSVYGANDTKNAVTLSNGVKVDAQKSAASKNFIIPSSVSGNVTIVFDQVNSKVTATWDGNSGSGGGNTGSGDWTNSTVTASNSLPKLYLTVEDNSIMSRNLADKDTRVGTYYLVDKDGNPLMGAEDAQLAMTIKARGNFTRTGFSKKPFKLKLDKKQSLLGLSKSKHYALLTHADDEKGYLTNFVGFWLGNNIFPNGTDIAPGHAKVFTPKEKPVELYINNVYWGLYFLTESIRVEETRINIPELADNETDPALLSGGYLVELDNYPDDNQITMQEAGKGQYDILRITPDTPEIYSDVQRKFVKEQFEKMNSLVGAKSEDLWKYMDLDMAARYYVVMEILGHWEAYHGSTYMYRDRGEGQKWMFSPLWDCGHALELSSGWFEDNATYGNTWIGLMKQTPKFMDKVKETYKWFWGTKTASLYSEMEEYERSIEAAAKKDHERWGNEPKPNQYNDPLNNGAKTDPHDVYDNSNLISKFAENKKVLVDRINWLNGQWGTPSSTATEPTWNEIPAAPLPDYVQEGYDPNKVVVPEDAAGVYPVFFKDELTADKICAYVYGVDNEKPCGSWDQNGSGQACTKVTINNVEYWYTIVNASKDSSDWKIIFNNGSSSQWPGQNETGWQLVKRAVYGTDGKTSTVIAAGTYGGTTPDNPDDPEIEDPWTGRTDPDDEISKASGTIPVLYIMTDDANFNIASITKETYVKAKYWLDPKNDTNVQAIGSRTDAKVMKFKGRGNYTFSGFDKKPYKLKFDKKAAPCGLAENKEFGLLAHADDNKAFLRNTVGFWVSKQIGLPWTPDQYPVEVMVNGKYQGMYLLTDLIAIDKNRVNIKKWVKEVENADGSVTELEKWQEGGSLVEIDNYPNDDEMNAGNYGPDQIHYKDCDDKWMRITYDKSTEAPYVPDGYETWLTNEFTRIDRLIGQHSSEVWNYLDLDDCAKFIIVQDIVGNYESFHGSCYLHREYGDGNKWHFSPVWDFGSAFNGNSRTDAHFWDCAEYPNHWIKHLIQIPEMKAKLAELYTAFNANELNGVNSYIENFISKITQAAAKDKTRWPQYGNDNLSGKLQEVKNFLAAKRSYLANEWKGTVVNPGETPDAWIISAKNGWNTTEKSSQLFSYDSTKKVYTITVAPADLRGNSGSGLGFKIGFGVNATEGWDNYYGPNTNDANVVLAKGVAANTQKGGDTKNFTVADDVTDNVTLTFDQVNGKLTATWGGSDDPQPTKPWWTSTDPDAGISNASGKLPVLYIMSKDEVYLNNVTDKSTKIKSYYWLDPKSSGVEAIGSKDAPKELTMKGRGNYTWTGFAKKPYKITFSEAETPCGMKSAKAFGLLAAADDKQAFLRNTVGFKLSEELGLPWTPGQYPVEVMFNGEYRGMYMLTDLIEIGENRVNITPWETEYELDENGQIKLDEAGKKIKTGKKIEGGSIIEIDNYEAEDQVMIKDYNNADMRFTYDKSVEGTETPDGYAGKLTQQFTTINGQIGNKNADVWNNLNIDDAARFILLEDLVGNYESFHGSCYLHKDLNGDKWHFSPVWDFGSAFNDDSKTNAHFWDQDTHYNHWVGNLYEIDGMKAKLAEYLAKLDDAKMNQIYSIIDAFINQIRDAAAKDKQRWPDYGNDDLNSKATNVKNFLRDKRSWLMTQLNVETPVDPTDAPDAWIISKNANSWSAAAKSDYKFTYDSSNKVYNITIDASKLQASANDGNGFKIGYDTATNDWSKIYGGVNRANTFSESGKQLSAVKDKDAPNFFIPSSVTGNVTLTFDQVNGKLTATWETGDTPNPTDGTLLAGHTYYVDASKCDYLTKDSAKIRVNDGSVDVEVTIIDGSLFSFVPTVNTKKITVKRYNPALDKVWNSQDADAPEDPETNNMFVFNGGFGAGGEWKPYVIPTKHVHNFVFIDRHSTPWEKVSVYVWGPGEHLGTWPGTAMTKKQNAPSMNRAASNGVTWTHSFESYNDASDYKVIYNNGETDNSKRQQMAETTIQENTAHVRTNNGLDTEDYVPTPSGIMAVGAEGYSVSVMNGMLVVNSDVEVMLPVVTIDGRVMMIEITPGVTMIGLDRGVYIVNGRKYAL